LTGNSHLKTKLPNLKKCWVKNNRKTTISFQKYKSSTKKSRLFLTKI